MFKKKKLMFLTKSFKVIMAKAAPFSKNTPKLQLDLAEQNVAFILRKLFIEKKNQCANVSKVSKPLRPFFAFE